MESRLVNIQEIPEVTGSYLIRSNGKALYADFSANIRSSIQFLLNVDRDGFEEVRSSQNTVQWFKAENLFLAMAKTRETVLEEQPELNRQIKLSNDYVYLAVDFHSAPVFQLESFTTGDKFYVGPFRNRFELMDTLYTMSELLQTPVCDEPNQPCTRLKSKKCIGWCLKKGDQRAMLLKYFLRPDFDWIHKMEKQIERLLDDLAFEKADLLRKQMRLLVSYYDNIRFLLCTKRIEGEIEMDGRTYRIKYGLLQTMRRDGIEHVFQSDRPMQYRENELMAVDKTEYDQRRAIYLWFLERRSDELQRWMELGIDDLQKKHTGG